MNNYHPNYINPRNLRAFNKIFEECYAELCYYSNRIIGNKEEAKDIVADSFCALYTSKDYYESMNNIRAFLYRVTKNKCINFLKKQNTKREYIFFIQTLIPHFIEDTLEVKEIYNHIQSLPPNKRKIFKLHYLDGYSRHEIAKLLNLSPNTVRNHYVDSLSFLRNLIKEY